MIIGRKEWERTTWRVSPRLDTDDLAPCAVQYAIIDADPVERLRTEIARSETIAPVDRADEAEAVRQGRREAAWESIFRDVPGDRVYLLEDYGLPEATDPAASTATRSFVSVLISSNDAEGQKWLVTKVLRAGGRRLVWSVPFQARRGHLTTIVLRESNASDLDAAYPPPHAGAAK